MEIWTLADVPHHPVDAFGSVAFTIGRLLEGTVSASHVARLDAGGVIGGHPTAGPQMLIVVCGEVLVHIDHGPRTTLTTGQAVSFTPGQWHETRATQDSVLLILEGDFAPTAPA